MRQPEEPPSGQTDSIEKKVPEKKCLKKNIEICHKNIAITIFADMLLYK